MFTAPYNDPARDAQSRYSSSASSDKTVVAYFRYRRGAIRVPRQKKSKPAVARGHKHIIDQCFVTGRLKCTIPLHTHTDQTGECWAPPAGKRKRPKFICKKKQHKKHVDSCYHLIRTCKIRATTD